MFRARAAAFLFLVAGCSTGQSDQMSSTAPQPKAADEQAVEAGAVGSAAAEAAALPPPPPPQPTPADGERPAATAGPGAADPGSQKAEEQPSKSSSGGGGKQRVFAAVVKGLQGSLTEEQVTKTVAGAKENLQACFSNAEARLEVSLQISGSGDVNNAGIIRSDPVDPRKSDCAAARLSKLKFPSPGQSLKLELALYLEPK
ncbi:MAG: hypothetical protein HOV80_37755 [Polyangiaceae bacterium]|nr:hypothetical protein [Polyangiaceae bacterium]